MSSTPVVVESVVAPVVVEPTVVPPTKATKKPSLPAKYSKFLSFGFWFASRLESDTRDVFYQHFKLFSSLEDQTEFFQTYLDEASTSNKIMRKTIANHNKPVKTRAPKASRKPSKPVAAETDDLIAKLVADANGEPIATTPAPEKQKKTRKPKSDNTDEKPKKEKKSKKVVEPVSEPVSESVSEPVSESVSESVVEPVSESVSESVSEPVVEPVVAKKTTKPKTEKVEKPKTEKVEKPKVDKAEKPKKVKKDKTEPLPITPEPVTEEDNSIQTRIVTMKDGGKFLMDSDNNLYDINSHEHIGTYNPLTDSAVMN